jgi:HEAT repeat protein
MWPFKPSIEGLKKRRNVNALLKILKSTDDQETAYAAVEALGDVGDPAAVGPLLDKLDYVDLDWNEAKLTRKVVQAIATMGEKAVPALLGRFDTKPDNTGMGINADVAAEKALVMIGRPAESHIIGALGHGNWLVRVSAAQTLGKMGTAASHAPLLALLIDNDDNVRTAAVKALESRGAVDALVAAVGMDGLDSRTQEQAQYALSRSGKAASGPVIPLLKTGNPRVRGAAAWILGAVCAKNAVGPLLECLGDEATRGFVSEALAKIGSKHGDIDALVGALGPGGHAREDAARELGRLAHRLSSRKQEVGELLIKALAEEDGGIRLKAAAATALGEIRYADAAPALTEALANPHPELHDAAAAALERLKSEGSSRSSDLVFAPECVACGRPMERISGLGTALEGGEIRCPHCSEVHRYLISSRMLTVTRVSVPEGYTGVYVKRFQPIT